MNTTKRTGCKLREQYAAELREAHPVEQPMIPLRFYTNLLIRTAELRIENRTLRRELAALQERMEQ